MHTNNWLYSRLKRARRFSGLLAAALFPAGEAKEVPAIKRDHCEVSRGDGVYRASGGSYKIHGSAEVMILSCCRIRVCRIDQRLKSFKPSKAPETRCGQGGFGHWLLFLVSCISRFIVLIPLFNVLTVNMRGLRT